MTAFASLLDVAAAPAGMVLERGVWFTHGVDLHLVADHVAPALVGESLREVAARRRRAAGFEHPAHPGRRPELVVVADGRHLSPGPPIPWIRVAPVHGRTQHAKFGVLVFGGAQGSDRRVRAFVSSANLTRGGLTSNREFLLVEERSVGTSKSLAADLLHALLEFLDSTSGARGDVRPADHSVLLALHRELRTTVGPGLGLVAHSLDRRRPLLPPATGAADRVDIVSPAFAAPTDKQVVSNLLAGHLAADTKVVWHLAAERDGGVVVPKAAWTELRERADTEVRVIEDSSGVHRPLHAKVIALTRFTPRAEIEVVAGSANFTSRGLGGRNRELVVRWSARDWLPLVDELDSRPLAGSPRFTTRHARDEGDDRLPLPVLTADHVEQDAEGGLMGLIRVTDIPRGVSVEVQVGRRWRTVGQLEGLSVPIGAALLKVRLSDRQGSVSIALVPLDCSGTRPDVWTLSGDRDVEVDTELNSLLTIVRRAAQDHRTTTSTSSTGGGTTPPKDDRYLRQLTQPLVLLARHRRELVELESPDLLEAALEEFDDVYPQEQWNPAVEGRVARAILGLSSGPGTALLRSVKELA